MMLVHRATSLSMMPRYSATTGSIVAPSRPLNRRRAAADRGERIVDLCITPAASSTAASFSD